VRHQRASHVLFGLASNYRRAAELAKYEVYWGDAGLLNAELDKYLAVTKEDVSRVVAKYLVPEHRSRVEVKPAAAPDTDAKQGPADKADKKAGTPGKGKKS
jgi:predicted Zn-dependent peptidase